MLDIITYVVSDVVLEFMCGDGNPNASLPKKVGLTLARLLLWGSVLIAGMWFIIAFRHHDFFAVLAGMAMVLAALIITTKQVFQTFRKPHRLNEH